MDILQTLGEKLSSMFVPSSDVVMEDVVQPTDSSVATTIVQKSAPKKKDVETLVKSEHKCTCGGH